MTLMTRAPYQPNNPTGTAFQRSALRLRHALHRRPETFPCLKPRSVPLFLDYRSFPKTAVSSQQTGPLLLGARGPQGLPLDLLVVRLALVIQSSILMKRLLSLMTLSTIKVSCVLLIFSILTSKVLSSSDVNAVW